MIIRKTHGPSVIRVGARREPRRTLSTESFSYSIPDGLSYDKSSYSSTGVMTVTFSGMPGNQKDWIGIAPSGSSASTVSTWKYINGSTSGQVQFSLGVLSAGTYVVRTFSNDSYTIVFQGNTFTVA